MLRKTTVSIYFIILFVIFNTAAADVKIAVLDFELRDLTLAPRIPTEIARTASIQPLLTDELAASGYTMIAVDSELQQWADSGVGYLFQHHDVAADLGKKLGADFVVVGRLHKPSFLFAYLMAHLVRVSDARLVGDFISEAKGPSQKMTIKAVESLRVKIDNRLQKYSATK